MKKLKLLLVVALSLSIMLFTVDGTLAHIGGRPAPSSISPHTGWFVYELEPGTRVDDTFLVLNTGKEVRNAVVYASDGINSSSGGFAGRQRSEAKTAVGAWVRFYPNPIPEQFSSAFANQGNSIVKFCALGIGGSQSWCQGQQEVELELQPGDRIEIPFTFHVPNNTKPGEHKGALWVQGIQKSNATSGMTLSTRSGARIYQTVEGEVEDDPCLPPGPPWTPGDPNPPGPPCNPGNPNPPAPPSNPNPPAPPSNPENPNPPAPPSNPGKPHNVSNTQVVDVEDVKESEEKQKDNKPNLPNIDLNHYALSSLPLNVRYQIMMSETSQYQINFGKNDRCMRFFNPNQTGTLEYLILCLMQINNQDG